MLENEKYKKAKGFFLKTLALDSKYKNARLNLGIAYLKLKDFNSAQDCFETVLKDSPKSFDVLFYLAQTLHVKGVYNQASDYYLKAIEVNDKSFDAYFNFGIVLFNQKMYKEALDSLQKANLLCPENDKILYYITRCNDELCDYEDESKAQQIIDDYMLLSQKSDLPKEIYISIAKAFAKIGEVEKAEEYCQKALVNNSEDVESYKLFGLIQLIKRDYVQTKNVLSTALHLQPQNRELHTLLSYVLCFQVDSCTLKNCRQKYFKLMKKFIK